MEYFVEILPQSCFFCDCCHTKDYDSRYRLDGEKICGIENMDVDNYYDHNYETGCRPNWCPLREIPNECLSKMVSCTTYRLEQLTKDDVIAESDVDVWELLSNKQKVEENKNEKGNQFI